MNRSTLALVLIALLLAFFVGRWSKSAPSSTSAAAGQTSNNSLSQPRIPRATQASTLSRADRAAQVRQAVETGENLTREQCLLLTQEERLDLVRKGALIFDGLKQAAYLEGVLSTLNKEEIGLVRTILAKAQRRGNACAQPVWDTLWKQAGRVNAEEVLAGFNRTKTRRDARHIMEGWFEADRAAALAWAQEPKETFHDAAAAAYALTQNADGDPEKLIESLVQLKPDDTVLTDCLQDYFDLADVSGTSQGTAAIYENLPESIKPHAWPVTMRRLSYTDAQEAVDWLAQHADEPGRDYEYTYRLFDELASEDPAGTTAWAASLPPSGESGASHPAEIAYRQWSRSNPEEAAAWLLTIEETLPWAERLRARK